MTIRFLEASGGALVMSTEIVGGRNYYCRSANQVAETLQAEGGPAEDLMHSSSYDFADEYGFKTPNGARELFEEGLAIYMGSDPSTSEYELSGKERDAVLAGLRLLQLHLESPSDGDWLGGDIHRIYTNGDDHEGLSLNEIDELCERLNV